jgi:hypothetical protein
VKSASNRPDLPRRGTLSRHQVVGIAELSRTGCRLEADEPIAIGENGVLTVDVHGEPHVEMFRVARVAFVEGGPHLFVAGLEFLPLPADAASLQDLVLRFEADTAER